jgi:Putative bacterial sensory transduction regulator
MTDKPKRVGVMPFDRDMIETHLTAREMEWDIDDDGDFRFGLNVDETDITLAVFLGAEGANEDVLSIRCVAMAAIPGEGWMQVISACNQWNVERRYPKAALVISQVEGAPADQPQAAGQVHLSAHYPLGAGVTQPLVDDLISETIGGALQFWQWMPGWLQQMADQQGLQVQHEAGQQTIDPTLN